MYHIHAPTLPLLGRNATIEVSWASHWAQTMMVPEADGHAQHYTQLIYIYTCGLCYKGDVKFALLKVCPCDHLAMHSHQDHEVVRS